MTYFLQESHSYSNKALPLNNAIYYELMEDIFIQTTTLSPPCQISSIGASLSWELAAFSLPVCGTEVTD